jgi:hypothetical protein
MSNPDVTPEPTPAVPAYQAAPPVGPVAKTNVLSIIALITGILGLAIVPVICGHISLSQIKRTGEQGRVMAIIGLVLGYLAILGWIIAWIVIAVVIGTSTSVSTY